MKDLQKNIINKNPNIKEMKYNFEKNKYLLYQKALKFIKNEDRNDIIKNDFKYNLSNKISKTFSIIIKNTVGDDNTLNNNNINSENTKELNLSIINLRKTIEDIKNNSQFLTEQLKSEVNILNNKIKEKNEKEKEYEKNIIENLTIIKKIYNILLLNSLEKKNFLKSKEIENNSVYYNTDQKFKWYSNEIIKYIDILINKNKDSKISDNKNINNNKNDIITENKNINKDISQNENNNFSDIKIELLKNINEILNLINPFISKDSKEKEKNVNNIRKTIEKNIEENKIKEALDIFKSKIKQFINIKNKENDKNKIIKNNNNNILCDDEDEENINDKNNFLQLNSTLLGIQNDLIKKIENKEEEIEKIKKDLKNSIQLNQEFINIAKNQKGQDINIFAEKYKYLLDLYNSEQEKVKFLQKEYMNLINGLSNYVNNGEEIKIELKKMWNLNPIIATNFEIADPEFPDIDPINETDLLTEKS